MCSAHDALGSMICALPCDVWTGGGVRSTSRSITHLINKLRIEFRAGEEFRVVFSPSFSVPEWLPSIFAARLG